MCLYYFDALKAKVQGGNMYEYSKKTLKTAKDLRLIDDTLFRLICADREVCQEILRTLIGDDKLVVISSVPQETLVNLNREIVVDVLCKLGNGQYANIEVQKGNNNDDVRRCRFHLASITANKTPKGTEFGSIPDVAILYISQYDVLGNNQAVTCTEMCQYVNGEYKPVGDGAKIYYANVNVRNDGDESELLSLFLKRDPFTNSKFPKLSAAVKYYKEDREGVRKMCEAVENYAMEREKKLAYKIASNLIAIGILNDEQIAESTNIPVDEVEKLRITHSDK
jgi:hypothetical protein